MRLWKGLVFLVLIFVSGLSLAGLKPYVLSSLDSGNLQETSKQIKEKLMEGGFKVVGEYAPYENARVIAITNDALKNLASKTEFGAYGAAVRVTATEVNGKVQVAYTNPRYWGAAYRMSGNFEKIASHLSRVLEKKLDFGSQKGLSEKDLRKYHYMFGMPYFDDALELATHKSYQEALRVVEEGLAKSRGGVSKVYRIDIPGKEETVFGVHMTKGKSGDKLVMGKIDNGTMKHTPHLCYELVVSKGKVYALNGRFRIAVSFPDLTMTTFGKIMQTPGAIESALERVANK